MELMVEVVGMKAFKGVVQGEPIDSGKLFARIKFDERYNEHGKNLSRGETVEEWKLPGAELVFRMQHLNLPFMCKLEVERMSNGKETREVVIGAVPVERPQVVQEKKAA